jgi:isopentenyl-diphosphate delta-isomerase
VTALEYLPVCDDQNRVVGRASREVIHAQGLLHRAVHVLVFNSKGQLFVQLRGPEKDTYPGCWDSSASGHVGLDETPEQAAHRELAEEIGLAGELALLGEQPACEETGWEFVSAYTLVTDDPPRWDGVEITDGRWMRPGEIREHIARGDFPLTPTFRRTFGLWSERRSSEKQT